ncbi:DUF4274 domain-containing protein [Saccharibacillus sp. CPCC 101409]|uniref:DUF4274 domain-containing protein n=1 Tax=Saccharibacillus sp. CPCC 101409 TaxID=3058041 RepID=UPI002673DFEB|nr:DUF4274 domain-containing protein [Saccharibacillus sp. CPCC 101409]MDO3409622.1 DUF4274 domain-containing protein [Saccharibacillus sp. CPCC 101409]
MMNWAEIARTKNVHAVRTAAGELDVNEKDERGRTPLMLFMTYKLPTEAIEILLERGAELEVTDKLGETALLKAIKFHQVGSVKLLLKYGAQIDSPAGIRSTPWNAARADRTLADLLLDTHGAVRLTLTSEEEQTLNALLYEENGQKLREGLRNLDSSVLLHAFVNAYNWDDGPEIMFDVLEHPACAEITLLDMYDLADGDYWLQAHPEDYADSEEGVRYRELAKRLRDRLESSLPENFR